MVVDSGGQGVTRAEVHVLRGVSRFRTALKLYSVNPAAPIVAQTLFLGSVSPIVFETPSVYFASGGGICVLAIAEFGSTGGGPPVLMATGTVPYDCHVPVMAAMGRVDAATGTVKYVPGPNH